MRGMGLSLFLMLASNVVVFNLFKFEWNPPKVNVPSLQ